MGIPTSLIAAVLATLVAGSALAQDVRPEAIGAAGSSGIVQRVDIGNSLVVIDDRVLHVHRASELRDRSGLLIPLSDLRPGMEVSVEIEPIGVGRHRLTTLRVEGNP